MSFPAHPYWIYVPTIFMGYLTSSSDFKNKNVTYSFLGTSTFLWTLRNFSILAQESAKPKILPAFMGAVIINGSIYCMGHLIGKVAYKNKELI